MVIQNIFTDWLDSVDIDTRPFVQLMVELLGLALFICHISRMDCHLCIGTGGAALGKGAGVDNEYTFDNLDCKDKSQCEGLGNWEDLGFAYLDKRRQHTGHDQNIGSNIPPLAEFHVGQV